MAKNNEKDHRPPMVDIGKMLDAAVDKAEALLIDCRKHYGEDHSAVQPLAHAYAQAFAVRKHWHECEEREKANPVKYEAPTIENT